VMGGQSAPNDSDFVSASVITRARVSEIFRILILPNDRAQDFTGGLVLEARSYSGRETFARELSQQLIPRSVTFITMSHSRK